MLTRFWLTPAIVAIVAIVALLAAWPQTSGEQMVREQIEARGVRNPRVLEAMRRVPRHRFVAPSLAGRAYEDNPLPIEAGQTISQPYIVAFMTEQVRPRAEHVALEVGTGSGYQAAVLSLLVSRVYSVEIVPELARSAAGRLKNLGFANVEVRQGDGYAGWPEHAPFDLIIVTAAPEHVPPPLIEQLKPGGRMIIPTGRRDSQKLRVVEKDARGQVTVRAVLPVAFVPLIREKNPGERHGGPPGLARPKSPVSFSPPVHLN